MTSPFSQGFVRGAALNFVGQVIPLVAGAVTLPFIVHRLGPEAFGFLVLVWAILGYFGIFDLGLSTSTTQLIAKTLALPDRTAVPRIAWSATLLHLGVGAVFGVITAGAVPQILHLIRLPDVWAADARESLYVLACAVPIVVTTGALRGILDAYRRFDLVNVVRLVAGSANFILPFLVLRAGGGLLAIIISLVALRLLSALVYGFMCLRLVDRRGGTGGVDLQITRRLFSFGGWVLIMNALGPIFAYLDRALIAALISVQAVGYYSPPYELASRLAVIPTSLAIVLFPTVSEMSAERRQEILPLVERLVKLTLLVMTPIVIAIATFAGPILFYWLGPAFAREGTTALQVLALGMLPNALAHIPLTVLYGVGRPDLATKAHVIELLVYGVGVWYLTLAHGITGAAIAWSVFLTLNAALYFVIMAYQLPGFPGIVSGSWRRLRPTIAGVAMLSGVFALFGALVDALPVRIIVACGVLAIFGWVAWSRLLEANDRAALSTGLRLRR